MAKILPVADTLKKLLQELIIPELEEIKQYKIIKKISH